jgi:hypothetical protein
MEAALPVILSPQDQHGADMFFFRRWLESLRNRWFGSRRRRAKKPELRRTSRIAVEPLEDRNLLSALFTVTSNGDTRIGVAAAGRDQQFQRHRCDGRRPQYD